MQDRVETDLDVRVDAPGIERVAAVFHPAATQAPRTALLLAHGSGADMHSEFLSFVARGLARRGFPVLRFRYPYMERMAREGTRRPPDRSDVLEAAHAAALERLRGLTGVRRPLAAGKSLGGRMASRLAAKGEDIRGLVLLGYPLHPARKPEKERSEHFAALVQPALFLQGTRDALCDLQRLQSALERYGGAAQVEVLEDADHSFDVPVRSARWQGRGELWEHLLERIDRWDRETFPK